MSVQIKYFASLRESLGRAGEQVAITEGMSVNELWQSATGKKGRPNQVLVAINQEYATFSSIVKDGDEVAFFPPVTGG